MGVQTCHDDPRSTWLPSAGDADKYEQTVRDLLAVAGIGVEGAQPYDLNVHNHRFYKRLLRQGSLGLGESYMDGWWDCDAIDELISRLMQGDLDKVVRHSPAYWLLILRSRLFNLQTANRAYRVAEAHYNLGNDLFIAMLDRNLCYSSGYWKDAGDLDQAQINKLDLLCRKLDLKPGEHVLDIGCGWGSFAQYAASKYGVRVTGVTISREQQKLASERCARLAVEIRLQDYRELEGQFDKIVSVGMFEHVGVKNYATYFDVVDRVLKEKGLAVLHTIGNDRSMLTTDPWIEKYIFPNGEIPALTEISRACEKRFIIDDVQNFGPDYDTTLMAWKERFEAAWPVLNKNYDQRFRRMWIYYLSVCAGAFRCGQLQLFHLVIRHRNKPRPRYDAPR